MILSVASQSAIFLMSVILGACAGFVYDLFRILRKTVRHPDFLTQLEDCIYWVFVSGFIFYFILNKNSGEVRFYIILGTFLGMGIYFLTLSRLIMAVSLTVVNFFKQVFMTLFKMITFPIKLLAHAVVPPVVGWAKELKKPAKKVLQKPARYAKIKTRGLARDLKIVFKKV